jgi:hypothetical protein
MTPLIFLGEDLEELSKNTSNSWAHLTLSIFENLNQDVKMFLLLKAPWGLGLWMQPHSLANPIQSI